MLTMPRTSADPDLELMLRIQDDCEAAFEELVRRHGSRIFGRFLRSCRDRQEAEDLTQETFLRVFRAHRRWQPRAKVATWLDRIAANVARNAARTRQRHAWLEYGDAESASPHAPLPLEHAELGACVRRALDQLIAKHRRVLELQHFGEKSYVEIARDVNLTPKATKCLLYRARIELRELLRSELL